MEKALALRSAAGVEVPGQAEHNALIKSYVEACWVWGHTHGLEEMERFNRRREVQFNDPPKPDNRGPAPAEAIKWAEQRVALQGNWHRSLDAQVTQAIVTGLETGATNKDVMGALGRIFPTFSKLRLENIARTESVSAYNQGRLTAFRSNRYVVAVQFASILDSRTTKICRARDGMIMRMEDDRLPANTPPLHFMCRSTIVPVDKFDFEDLQNGVEAVEKQYFGWLDKDGPKSLTQATSAWDETPKPLPGFGSVHDIGKKPSVPPDQPEPTLKEQVIKAITQDGKIAKEDVTPLDLARGGKIVADAIKARGNWDDVEAKSAWNKAIEANDKLMKERDLATGSKRDELNNIINRKTSQDVWKREDDYKDRLRELSPDWNKAVKDTLKDIRSIGNAPVITFYPGADEGVAQSIQGAINELPQEWGEAVSIWSKSRPLDAKRVAKGDCRYTKAINTIYSNGDETVALHEACHWIEDGAFGKTNKSGISEIPRITFEWLKSNTGSSTELMSHIDPRGVYPERLYGKKSKIAFHYMSAIYPENSREYILGGGSEVLSCGVQCVYYRDADPYDLWNTEPETIHFILGMLSFI